MKLRFFLILLALFLSLPTSASAAPVSASLPLGNWIYPALDKLAGLGLIESALQGSCPFSRLEAARLTREAQDNAAMGSPPAVVGELLRRLAHELRSELEEVEGGLARSYLQPVREIRLDYIYQEGGPSTIVGTNARQHALNANNLGIDYADGHSGQALLETEARLGSFFLLNWRPLLLLDEQGDTDLRTLHGTATLGLGPIHVSVGRESLWWGQGRHGSLVLTNNAKPLDMVRVNNPTPVLLPWVFRYLGPFRFDAFWSRLDDYVANADTGRGDEPYFAGLRLNFKPLPWFELGASRAVMFGGDDINVGTSDFITILGGKNLEEDDNSNSVAAIDVRIRLPFFRGAEVYGELGGEDEYKLFDLIPFISNKAWLAGLYLPQIEPSGRLSLRLEYADLSHIDDNSPPWYRHGIYRSGYTYERKVLGHHVGGAAKDYFGELELRLPGDVILTTGLDFEERGTDQAVQEEHFQPFLGVEWALQQGFTLHASYAFDRVKNIAYLAGEKRTDHFARFAVSRRW